jgi:hypothetical protein
MRLFLFILILLPISSFNQEKLDLRDLKSISSKSTFQKVVLENGFSKSYSSNSYGAYGYKLDKSDNENHLAHAWAYFNDYEIFTFTFQFFDFNDTRETYNKIVSQIQSSCSFHSIDESDGYDIIYYGCPGSRFKGIIGYYDNGEDRLYIKTKIPTRN